MKKGIHDYLKGIISFLKAFILNMFTYIKHIFHMLDRRPKVREII